MAAIPATGLAALRIDARAAYAMGRLAEAAGAQSAVLALAKAAGVQTGDDFLFAGLIHHAAGRLADALSVLKDGLCLFPDNAALHENLAVLALKARDTAAAIAACQTALALGSRSPNVHDCLCEAYWRTGLRDRAIEAGRVALESKDRMFGASSPLATIPAGKPPPFDPGQPSQNVVAYTLWGNQPRYTVPLLENARIRPHLFPAWTIRVYHDRTVDPAYLAQLAALGVQLRPMLLDYGGPPYRALLWRFEAFADLDVKRFLIRDADSLLTVKERIAVDAWLRSDYHFHAMRDWYSHTDLLLAGLFGGVGGILPSPAALLREYKPWRMESDHIDQDLLAQAVWPAIRHDLLVHDSIFQPCLGSVAFPPFGDLPAGQHIGQNAFPLFSKSG